jgi:hypothetical protein
MKAIRAIGTAALIGLAGLALLYASDFVGVYARVDKVVLEPNAEAPERIQIWGVFSLADPQNGRDYAPAVRGYLYFKPGRNEQATRAEWNDLKQLAGSGQIVAFGTRGSRPSLRKSDEKPANPDVYGTNTGLIKVNGKSDYPPVKALLEFKD